MAWTTPKTDWTTGELVSAEDMNEVGENLATLKHPATAVGVTTSEFARTSAEFIDVDSDNLNLTITTTGGDVLAHFHGAMTRRSSNVRIAFDIDIDGNRQGGNNGILRHEVDNMWRVVSFTYPIANLDAGSHTFKLQWKFYNSHEIKLIKGSRFWVREI